MASSSTLSEKQRAYGKFTGDDAQKAYRKCLESGVRFLDTADSYGSSYASAHKILTPLLQDRELRRERPMVAPSFRKTGLRTSTGKVFNSLRKSLKEMQLEEASLYQARKPLVGGLNALANGFVEGIDEGYCTRVGGINLSAGAMKSLQKKLKRRGEYLCTNAVSEWEWECIGI